MINEHASAENATLASLASVSNGLSSNDINTAVIPEEMQQLLDKGTFDELKGHGQQLVVSRAELMAVIREEEQSARSEQERAASRRHDFGPLIQRWMHILADNQLAEPLFQTAMTG
jgi:ubiquitin carboxyl-terminal hydrolase L5